MPSIEEALVSEWWSAENCRSVMIAEAAYKHVWLTAFENRRPSQAEGRALAAILTGLSALDFIGVDVVEVAAACVVDEWSVNVVLRRLAHVGLAHRGHRGYERRTGRVGWSWRLAGGLYIRTTGAAWSVDPTYYPERGRVEFHATPCVIDAA